MSLKYKIMVLLLVLVFGSGIAALAFSMFDMQAKLRVEAERYATTVAGMLSRLAGVAEIVIKDAEAILDNQMISQAKIAAHMVAAAEKAGESPAEIRARLKDIVADTDVDEFWITDPQGRAYLTNIDGYDFRFSPDPAQQPQAHVFYQLLTGDAEHVAQESRVREITDDIFKYVGTRGVDMPRIVQVGYDFSFMQNLADRIGLKRLVDAIIKDRRVDAIWVFNRQLSTLAHGSVLGLSEPGELSIVDREAIASVLQSGETELAFETSHIRVVAPIPVPDDPRPLGVTLIRFPIAALRNLLKNTVRDAVVLGAIVLFVAGVVAAVVGGRLSRPILALTESARALEGGVLALDPLEPFTTRKDELGVFVREFQGMALDIHRREESLDRLVKTRTAELEAAQKQIRDEVALASRFQLAILPASFPQHTRYSVRGFMRPAKEMGGDFYDIFMIDENRIGLVIADVSDKGVPAAFFMAVSRTQLRNEGLTGDDPGVVLSRVNRQLCEENPLNLFVTVFYAVLDHSTGILRYANGGHNPPYVIRMGGNVETIPSTGDLILGMVQDIMFHTNVVKLGPADTLFLYTDGISEAFNAENEEFTNARMEQVLSGNKIGSVTDMIDRMLSAIGDHVGNAAQSDDITCLALRYVGQGESGQFFVDDDDLT